MNRQNASREIVDVLGLEWPPVALSFVQERPPEVPQFEGEVPSACTFWRRAEGGVFFAGAREHANCLIGAMTMGFDMAEAQQTELMGLVQKMCDCGYLSMDEAAKIPSVAKPKAGIVYGPLAEFPLEPDLVLMWVSPEQSMIYNEAVGNAAWTKSPTSVFGRPACAALPMAFNQEQATMSTGCMGMRTFTEIPADRMLAVLPATMLDGFVDRLRSTFEANETMRQFYEGHKAAFTA